MSIRQFIGELKRHPMLANITEEAIISYTVDFLQIVGIPNVYENKCTTLTLKNYRAALPDDFLDMVQVRTTDKPPRYYRYSTDTFHYSENKVYAEPLTYKIQGGIIYTSEEKGDIEISYNAIDIDDCGFPMIPDDAKFTRALKAYIKFEWFKILFDMQKIPQAVLDKAEQDYCWAVGACESSSHKVSLDKAESLINLANSIFIPRGLHHRGYANSGNKTMIKIR